MIFTLDLHFSSDSLLVPPAAAHGGWGPQQVTKDVPLLSSESQDFPGSLHHRPVVFHGPPTGIPYAIFSQVDFLDHLLFCRPGSSCFPPKPKKNMKK